MTLAIDKRDGRALVTLCIVNAWQRRQNWYDASHRQSGLNYLAVPIRWSTLVMKVTGRMHSDTFKRTLNLQLHSNNFGLKQLSATVRKFHYQGTASFQKIIYMGYYAFLSNKSLFTWLPFDVIVYFITILAVVVLIHMYIRVRTYILVCIMYIHLLDDTHTDTNTTALPI